MKEINRQGVIYRQLTNGTLTCGPLDQSGMLGGTGEADRNEIHNPTRLARIKEFHPNPKVLDFGCGKGLFMDFLQINGVVAVGYDKYGMEKDALKDGDFPPEMFDVVTMIEVIEHTAAPYEELDAIFKTLKPGGILMVETTFTDFIDPETDPYVNPAIGHSTIFSHAGLDELMTEKGFEVGNHINRNVRLYKKPGGKKWEPKITLITMGQGNPVALRRTIESFKGVVDEVVFGDVLIFDSDREEIERQTYYCDYHIVRLPFNYIYKHGFSATLNKLAEHARHDYVLYMNVGEVMDGEHFVKEQMSPEYNCYFLDHAVETHRWGRLYNRKELKWSGLIHEEVTGPLRPSPFNVMRFADTEKDMDDAFKAKVYNDVKELCYFQQYMKLVEEQHLRGNTNAYWIQHAEEAYDSYVERMQKKGNRWRAFMESNLSMYLEDVYTNPEFEKERFESSQLINFQGDRKLL